MDLVDKVMVHGIGDNLLGPIIDFIVNHHLLADIQACLRIALADHIHWTLIAKHCIKICFHKFCSKCNHDEAP